MNSAEMEGGSNSHNTIKKCALLLIVGESFSEDDRKLILAEVTKEDDRKLILAEVTKGFSCWDTELIGFDINDELADIANRAALGEEGPNGERTISHISDNLAAEILVNPQSSSLINAVKNFLSLHTKHKHLIYAKHAFQGTGSWILQDDVFTFHDFANIFKDTNIDNAIRQQQGTSLYMCTGAEDDWNNSHIAKSDFSKILDVKLNPPAKLETLHGVLQFTAYVSNFVRVRQLNELLQSSVVVGNIRFTRPMLYIFPAGQGDSALFCVNGFNLLVNGGYSRKACFWDFTCHLDRIDAVLITHLGTDNLFGIQSVFHRKSIENVHPDIGYLYCNTPDKMKTLTEITPEESGNKESLLINLAEEGDKLVHYAKQIGLTPQPCLRTVHGNSIEPINLYQKIGIGSLDMFILNPVTDSKELKDFFHQWNQKVAHFGTNQHLSLPSTLSVCALLVWHPADPNMNISRILFPGNAPQHKILDGLEKIKNLDILKHPSCTKMSLNTKQAIKKPAAGLFTKPSKSKVSPVITQKNEMPKNEVSKKEVKEPVPPKTALPAKEKPVPLQKAKKEDVNIKAMKGPEMQKLGKSDKVKQIKPTKSNSSTKAYAKSSATSTPKEKSSPAVKTPESVQVQDVHEGESEVHGGEPEAHEGEPKVHEGEPEVHEGEQEVHKREQEIHDSKIQAEDHTPSTSESGDHTSCDLLDNENDDIHVDSANSQTDSFKPIHVIMEESGSLVEVTALEEQESVVEVAESDDVTASEIYNKNQFALKSQQIHGSAALDKEKMYELGIYNKDQDIENESDDEPESDEKSQQRYEGLTDSMHQDLQGDVYQQDAMQGSFHGDLMTGSIHESMFDNGQPFGDQGCMQNEEDIFTPEDETSEEIHPQALPEPVAYAPDSYIQEPDVIPTSPNKEQSHVALCEGIISKIQEPDVLPIKQDLFDQASLDVKADDQVKIFDYKTTTPFFDEHEEPLIQMSEEMAIVITQECVEDNEDIEEKVMENNKQINSVAAMLDVAAEDMKGSCIDMDVPSDITGDLRQSSLDDKENLVHGQEVESHIDVFDLLMQSRGDEPTEIISEMQNQVEEPSCVHDAIERQHISETELSEQQLFCNIDEEDKYQSIIVQKKYEHFGEDDTNVSDNNKSDKFNREEIYKNVERIPSTELTESLVNMEEDEHIDECNKWDDKLKQQKFQIPEVSQEKLTNANLREFSGDNNENIYQTDDKDKIENDFEDEARNEPLTEKSYMPLNYQVKQDSENETTACKQGTEDINRYLLEKEYCKETSHSPEPESEELGCGMENDFEDETQNVLQEIHDSEDVRAESPDSLQSNKDIHIDSLEIEYCKNTNQNPELQSEQFKGGMEMDYEQQQSENDGHLGTGDQVDEAESSEDNEFDQKERNMYETDETDQQNETKECERNLEQTKNVLDSRESVERDIPDASPCPDSHRGSADQSHENDSDKSEEDEVGESSSFEQEEITNEKYLMQDSTSETQQGWDERPFELVQGDPFAEQTSDNLMAPPESDIMEQRNGGQMGYHQKDDQGDSAEGFVDQDYAAAIPVDQNIKTYLDQDYSYTEGPEEFNPSSEWGEPMGLPFPAPPDDKAVGTATTAKNSPKPKVGSKVSDTKKTDEKKLDAKTPAMSLTKMSTSAPKSGASNDVPEKTTSRLSTGGPVANSSSSKSSAIVIPSKVSTVEKPASAKAATKPRAVSAPVKDKEVTDSKPKQNGTKRPTIGNVSVIPPAAVKMPSLPPFSSYCFDLTYIPNHGNLNYVDIEFFKRVRARYYVLSALSPSTQVLDALLEGKKTWEVRTLPVTVIPTYDNEAMQLWMILNKNKLTEENVEIAPSASHCTIQLQDHETSSSAYRLEF